MLTFDEALATLPAGTLPTVLLGNGFSQAWNAAIFNYASLLQVANFGDRDVQIRTLFERLIANATAYLGGPLTTVNFFDASTVAPWG